MPQQAHLWITDPWTTLDHRQDTTLRLAQEAALQGVHQYWYNVKTIHLNNTIVQLQVQKILEIGEKREAESFQLGEIEIYEPKNFTSIHYRTDPPVDLAYLHPLQLLHLALQEIKTCEVVNPLAVLLSLNEKMQAAALHHLMPPSLVASQWEHLEAFGKKHIRTVLKPLHEAQSHGIELLHWQTPTHREESWAKIDAATHHFQTPVILQTYLDGIAEGETRLWFMDGKLLAFIKKLPIEGDFRVNIDQGSRLVSTTLSPKDHKNAEIISQHLHHQKIRLAAVDLIDGYVTDFNFTSPGLIPQIEKILSQNLAQSIVKKLFQT